MQYGETGQHSDEVGHNVDSHALVGSYDIERLLATDGDIYGAYDAAAKYRLAPDHRNKHYRATCDCIGWCVPRVPARARDHQFYPLAGSNPPSPASAAAPGLHGRFHAQLQQGTMPGVLV